MLRASAFCSSTPAASTTSRFARGSFGAVVRQAAPPSGLADLLDSPPPPLFLRNPAKSGRISRRLHYLSTTGQDGRGIQQPNRRIQDDWTQTHLALRRREVAVSGQLPNGPGWGTLHGQVRTERVPKNMHTSIREMSPTSGLVHPHLHNLLRQ